jgi:hypothetical protein
METRRLKSLAGSPLGPGLAVAVHMWGCVSGTESPVARPAAAATASPVAPRLTVAWRNTKLHPIDQPKTIGATMVGIVSADNRKLFLVGSIRRRRWRAIRSALDQQHRSPRPGGWSG